MNTEKNQNIWIEKVHQNLILRGRSERTVINYKSTLLRFFDFFDSNTYIKKLKEKDIINFLNDEYIKLNKCKNTYNLAVCSIRLLYIVCFNISLNRVLLPTSKLVKKLPTIIPKDIFLKIINNEPILKHKCWLILAFCCGLRVNEVANVKFEDLNFKEHKLKVLGKGNKERYTILPNIVIKLLNIYCINNNISIGYIFKGTNGKPRMNEKTIINYFSVIKDTYNLNDNISFHSLRHSFATYYLSSGGSLLKLKSMFGHTNLNTTTIYLHLSQDFNELEDKRHV
ncbi:MAG: tyrosine-type recombinase/integrase [Candidatus Aphodocola sp.]